ncbi:hypothetical protein [Luteolibacter sp. Populi]|uniref:hypothetical protein n=1 Tax=Luteolibacter sp. Populi TaxID=3230487 RepID=UPI0034660718
MLRKARESKAAEKADVLLSLYKRWDEAEGSLKGQVLLDVRQQIARDAVVHLGGHDLLLKFLEFLEAEGQGDLREWVLSEGLRELFSSPERGEAAREWLVDLEVAKLQESMSFTAGQTFQGPGFKAYLDSFESIHSQSRLLGGYFSEMAKQDPSGAVKGFLATKPAKVDFTAMKYVMAAVPAGSDFVSISAMVPPDSQALAKTSRRALLGAWAASAPQEAGDYILGNTKLVHADQLGPVVEQWMQIDATAAAAWVQGLAPGDHRDIAMASQSKQLAAGDPAQAWPVAMAVADKKRREEAMHEVHRLWMKTDPKTADAAWKEMRGEKK